MPMYMYTCNFTCVSCKHRRRSIKLVLTPVKNTPPALASTIDKTKSIHIGSHPRCCIERERFLANSCCPVFFVSLVIFFQLEQKALKVRVGVRVVIHIVYEVNSAISSEVLLRSS